MRGKLLLERKGERMGGGGGEGNYGRGVDGSQVELHSSTGL